MSPEDFRAKFDVSRETLGRLESYAGLLRQWQKTINLVSPTTLDDVWFRHFADSAQLAGLMPPGVRHVIDLGSGGGFPGLVLAIVLAERWPASADSLMMPKVTLIESDRRKCAFLREVSRVSGIAVDIISSRIESICKSDTLAPADVITSRALAPMQRLLDLAAPIFGSETVGLFLKGRTVEDELRDARRSWSFDLDLKPSMTDLQARIVVIRGLKHNKEARS